MEDVIIIGGSFARLAAALQRGCARRHVLVIDVVQPRNRFAQHTHGFLGYDGRLPQAILQNARDQLARWPIWCRVTEPLTAPHRVRRLSIAQRRAIAGE